MHGHFEDVMAIDTAFFKHLEDVFPGSDMRAHSGLHAMKFLRMPRLS